MTITSSRALAPLGSSCSSKVEMPDVVVVPIGGGGLIAGVAVAIKEASPQTRVIGVEPTAATVMRQSVDAGKALRVMPEATIADGLAAPMAGERNFAIVQRYVDDIVLVSDDEIIYAMQMLLSRCKLLAEGAGAAAAAAILAGRIPLNGTERVVALVSGGNVDLQRLGGVLQ